MGASERIRAYLELALEEISAARLLAAPAIYSGV